MFYNLKHFISDTVFTAFFIENEGLLWAKQIAKNVK
jgi:hypothetical protein